MPQLKSRKADTSVIPEIIHQFPQIDHVIDSSTDSREEYVRVLDSIAKPNEIFTLFKEVTIAIEIKVVKSNRSGIAHLINIAESPRGLSCLMIHIGEIYYAYCPQLLLVADADTKEQAYYNLRELAIFHLDTLTWQEVEQELEQAEEGHISLLGELLEPEKGKQLPKLSGRVIPPEDIIEMVFSQNID